ncbi:tetrapyrrole methylase [Peptostreptococcaceae bacterium AS15]|nr:tetrapyrrole methylase [Peptostreptococcaceae bacterium AS15]
MKIFIIGLGPGNIDLISKKAYDLIFDSKVRKIFRTKQHEMINELESKNIDFESMDYLYDSSENFEEVYGKITDYVIESVKKYDTIVYAVPGSPFVTEETPKMIIEKSEIEKIDVEIIPSVSFIDSIICSLKKDPTRNLYISDYFNIDITRINPHDNILISQVYDRFKASDLKIKLLEIYDDEQDIFIVNSSGGKEEKVEKVKLYEMDYGHIQYNHLTSIFIESVKEKKFKDFYDLKKEFEEISDNIDKIYDLDFLSIEDNESIKIISKFIKTEDYVKIEDILSEKIVNIFLIISLLEKSEIYSIGDIVNTAFYKLKNIKKRLKIE